MKKIKVTNSANYQGQHMNWTETFTGQKVIGNGGEFVFHRSDSKINEFLAKRLCVSPFEHGKSYLESNATKKETTSKNNWVSFIYVIFLPAGTVVDTYSDDEYRFDLDDSFDVYFSGTVIESKKSIERKMTNSGIKEITTYNKYSNCKLPK